MFFPHEVATLPKDLKQAWKYLGNAIASNHAIFALATMMPLLLQEHSIPKPHEVLQTLIEKRMQVQNGQWIDLPNHWLVCKSRSRIIAFCFFLKWNEGKTSITNLAISWKQSRMIPKQIEISPTVVDGWMTLLVAIGKI